MRNKYATRQRGRVDMLVHEALVLTWALWLRTVCLNSISYVLESVKCEERLRVYVGSVLAPSSDILELVWPQLAEHTRNTK